MAMGARRKEGAALAPKKVNPSKRKRKSKASPKRIRKMTRMGCFFICLGL
jgi:hypothetical protein